MPLSALIDFLIQQMRINDFAGDSGSGAEPLDAPGARRPSAESVAAATAGSRSASSLGLLDEMIDEAPKEEEGIFSIGIETNPGVTGGLLLSASVLWWATRSGGLLAAMMASVPAWRSFDPLPILARSNAGSGSGSAAAEAAESGWMADAPASGAAAASIARPMLEEMAGGE